MKAKHFCLSFLTLRCERGAASGFEEGRGILHGSQTYSVLSCRGLRESMTEIRGYSWKEGKTEWEDVGRNPSCGWTAWNDVKKYSCIYYQQYLDYERSLWFNKLRYIFFSKTLWFPPALPNFLLGCFFVALCWILWAVMLNRFTFMKKKIPSWCDLGLFRWNYVK